MQTRSLRRSRTLTEKQKLAFQNYRVRSLKNIKDVLDLNIFQIMEIINETIDTSKKIYQKLCTEVTPTCTNALKLFEKTTKVASFVPTGIKTLDETLGGTDESRPFLCVPTRVPNFSPYLGESVLTAQG